ncbi:hypothetical protein ACIHAX_12910 [Nocardia sp. NPDC051929]|uniref:hypothetical protein n=1 Tax=Nocardia sp. NPDC051929 TaxID=3364327 RepID=UPI0037C6D72C
MSDIEDGRQLASVGRTETQVIADLSDEQRAFLKRVLEIERAKLHLRAHRATDDLLAAVKEIIP